LLSCPNLQFRLTFPSSSQEQNAAMVEKVLAQLSESDIPNVVNALSLEACDLLMKYVYKFMERTSNSASLLKLHAQLLEKAGIGSIVRVLTERKQV
jgi:actin related protein 2/3 complex subunit 5